MTRKDLAQLDPENQRIVRIVRNLAIALVGSVVFLAAVIAIVTWRGEDTRSIVTRVSACERDPGGQDCQRIRREAEKGETLRDACRRFWRVGYPCPKPGTGKTISSLRSTRGGDALQPASGGQEPASGSPEASDPPTKHKPPADRDPDDVGEGDDQVVPPAAQTNAPASIDTPGNGNGPPADSPAAEAPSLVGDVTGPLGGAIDDVGKGVDKALCPVVDRLAGLCD